jgi:cytochrome c oxidase assembly protein subunit 20
MADDTRQPNHSPSNDATVADESAPLQKKRKHDFPKTQAGKMWEAFGNPTEPVNEIPGGTYNSAGGKPKEITWKDAFNWKLSDAQRFYRVPCARDALLVGGGGGAAVGGLTAIVGGKMNMIQEILIKKKVCSLRAPGLKATWRAANFAVAGFAIFSMGQYAWCESRRREEAKGMALAVIGMKKLEEKRRREKETEEARAAAEAERLREEQRQKQKSSWSFW